MRTSVIIPNLKAKENRPIGEVGLVGTSNLTLQVPQNFLEPLSYFKRAYKITLSLASSPLIPPPQNLIFNPSNSVILSFHKGFFLFFASF